eukprot:2086509-Amphidinium_carterae.1
MAKRLECLTSLPRWGTVWREPLQRLVKSWSCLSLVGGLDWLIVLPSWHSALHEHNVMMYDDCW